MNAKFLQMSNDTEKTIDKIVTADYLQSVSKNKR